MRPKAAGQQPESPRFGRVRKREFRFARTVPSRLVHTPTKSKRGPEREISRACYYPLLRLQRPDALRAIPTAVAATVPVARAGGEDSDEITSRRERNDVKVRPSVKPMCEKCKIVRRHGRVLVICSNPRH